LRREREIKLQVDSYEEAERTLLEHGFKYVDTCSEDDYYYSHPCVDFSATDEALRARRRRCSGSEYYTITYKGPRVVEESGIKARSELEVELTSSQWSALRDIIEKLGFKSIARISKTRRLYRAECVDASLDELHGVGYYLELELKCDSGESLVREVVSRLSGSARIVHETYLEICLATRRCV